MKYIALKSILSKWLFTAVVVLSFFTFSGFVSPSTIKIAAPNTTLIVKNSGSPVKSICYRFISKPTAHKGRLNLFPVNDFAKLSHAHTQQARLLIKQTKKTVINKRMAHFFRAVIYPQTQADGTDLI